MSAMTSPAYGPRRAALLAGALGIKAYRAGKPPTAVPFGHSRPLVRRAWITGYAAARRADTGEDLADVEERTGDGAPDLAVDPAAR